MAKVVPERLAAYVARPKGIVDAGDSSHPVQLNVLIRRLDIHGDPDGFLAGVGDYYYQIDLNGQQVVARERNQTISVDPGQTIELNASKTIDVGRGAVIRISGWVSDADDGITNGADDWCGDFDLHIREGDIPENGSWYETSRRFQGEDDTGQTIHVGVRRVI